MCRRVVCALCARAHRAHACILISDSVAAMEKTECSSHTRISRQIEFLFYKFDQLRQFNYSKHIWNRPFVCSLFIRYFWVEIGWKLYKLLKKCNLHLFFALIAFQDDSIPKHLPNIANVSYLLCVCFFYIYIFFNFHFHRCKSMVLCFSIAMSKRNVWYLRCVFT